jgi:hypothetical protein
MVESKSPAKHAHFNDSELDEYDKSRGQKMKITDPKTPYHEDEEEAASNEASCCLVESEDIEIIEHLKAAKINRDKNAKVGPADLSALTSKL